MDNFTRTDQDKKPREGPTESEAIKQKKWRDSTEDEQSADTDISEKKRKKGKRWLQFILYLVEIFSIGFKIVKYIVEFFKGL